MSSETLFKVAGAIMLLTPLGHTKMAMDVLNPGLVPLGNTDAAYSSKISWTQANGYFIATALLCYKWATKGVQDSLDKYVLAALVTTHSLSGLMYARRSLFGPPLVYWTSSLLMCIAAVHGA